MDRLVITMTLDDMAAEFIETRPGEFKTNDDWDECLDKRFDDVVDYAESQGYQYDGMKEIFFKKVLTMPASVLL